MAFTFFFRDNHTLEQLVKHLLPTVQGRSNIKIWDAGCAMGLNLHPGDSACGEDESSP